MAIKAKVGEFISDMKSITQMPLFTMSPAKKTSKDENDGKKDEKVKTKLLEAWNNIRYDLGSGATLKKDIPIWILGICHHSRSQSIDAQPEEQDDDAPVFDSPLARRVFTDFASRPWFTYRKNFPPIAGREWRWLQRQSRHQKNVHKEILGWFIDDPKCPLSIHELSEIGRKFDNIPGNWYGPNTAAYMMQQALSLAKEKHPKLGQVVIYVAPDCTIYSEDVYDLCEWNKDSSDKELESASQDDQANDDSSSSCSTSYGVSVDEVGSEASEMSSFFIPTFDNEDTLSAPKIVDNMVPMTGLQNSDPPPQNDREEWTKVDKTDNQPIFVQNNPQPGNLTVKISDLEKNENAVQQNTVTDVNGSCVVLPDVEESVITEPWFKVQKPEDATETKNMGKIKEIMQRSTAAKTDRKTVTQNYKKKVKKGKISLYDSPEDETDSKRALPNGRSIMPHFRVDTEKVETQQKPSNSRIRRMFEGLSSRPGRGSVPQNSDQLDQSDNMSKNVKSNKPCNSEHLKSRTGAVTQLPQPKPSSSIFTSFKRNTSNTNRGRPYDAEILNTATETKPVSVWVKTDEQDSEDRFLSSFIEPSIPDFSNHVDGSLQSSMKHSSKSTNPSSDNYLNRKNCSKIPENSNSVNSQNTEGHLLSKNKSTTENLISSTTDEVFETKQVKSNSSMEVLDENNLTRSSTLPQSGEQRKSGANRPILIPRRSSSTSGVRQRSSTLGESTFRQDEKRRSVQKKLAKSEGVHKNSTHHKAVLILIPVRLGESALNPIYAPCVESMLSLEYSIGIIGGRPKHSLYFVGCQGSNLLHLDPHYCQPADTVFGYTKNLHDYHTMSIRKVNVKKIDPSCCLGFYCRNPEEFEQFKKEGRKNFSPPQQPVNYPMCLIMDGRLGDHRLNTPIGSPNDASDDAFSIIKNASSTSAIDFGASNFEDDFTLEPKAGKKSNGELDLVNRQQRTPVKKSKTEGFSMDGVSSTLNKLNPFPNFMRQKSSSPSMKRNNASANENEKSLESQFELL